MGIASDIVGQDRLDMQPDDEADSKELAQHIVNRVWRQPPMQHVADVVDAEVKDCPETYCICDSSTCFHKYNAHVSIMETLLLIVID